MSKIKSVTGRMILDSRGIPTVEASVVLDNGVGVASVPSGASTGSHEAHELRDGDRRWNGKGVAKAVSHVNVELASALKGKDAEPEAVDMLLRETDGTYDKSRLGANALLAVSLATLHAIANAEEQPLWKLVGKWSGNKSPATIPVPLCNVINGGAHADNALSIQEFMFVPHGFASYSEAVRALSECFQALAKVLHGRDLSSAVGDEGGYAPQIDSHRTALDLMMESVKAAGYEPGKQISLALDVAANEFLKDGSYIFDGQPLSAEQLVALYAQLVEQYPIVSIEDPLAEDDWDGWRLFRKRLGEQVQIVGDDLTVTNVTRIREALADEVISAVILKPNQIGTFSETFSAWQVVVEGKLSGILSHRSGETNDATIIDLGVGWGANQVKIGSVARGERLAKYNRLLAIEAALGGSAVYAGKYAFGSYTK